MSNGILDSRYTLISFLKESTLLPLVSIIG